QPGLLFRIFDYLSRPGYAGASAAVEAVQGEWGDIRQGFVQSRRGERRGSLRDVALELGVSDRLIIPASEGIPVLGASWAGALGYLGDVVFDPLNSVGIGALNCAGRAAQAAGKLKGLRSAQALAGQTDLITIAGRGPSSLPARAGEI